MLTEASDWRGTWKLMNCADLDGRTTLQVFDSNGYKVTETSLEAIRDQTIQLLEGLGLNEMEVADNLKKAGIQGGRHEAGSCPVANYLRKQLGLPELHQDISVQQHWSWVWGAEVENPKAVAAFVTYFDDECYPELDDGTGR